MQKYSEDYGKFETSNKLSYSEFSRYLEANYGCNFYGKIYSQIKQMATDLVNSVILKIDKDLRLHNFELFGLDFMIDEWF